MTTHQIAYEESSGNVFADLGLDPSLKEPVKNLVPKAPNVEKKKSDQDTESGKAAVNF